MAIIQIPNLPAVIGLDGSELFEGVQAGSSVKISLNQMIAAARGGTPATLPIPVSLGGTGLSSFTVGDIMYASATQTFSKLADVATGNAIISGGVGAAPSYGKIGLTTHVSGVLPVANGGTNQSGALTQYGVIYSDTTTSMASSAAGTSTTLLHGNAAGAPTWGAVSLTADVSGTLPVANGGTNITSYTIGAIPYASTAGVLSQLLDVATGNAIISGGVGVAPSYGKIGLTTHISGTLPVANGGTNITSYAVGDILYASATGVLSSLADVATGNVIISGGVGVAPSYGKVGLTTHVSGTLGVGNGGTGQASNLTQYGVVYGSTTTAMATTAAGTTTTVLHGNAAGAPTFGAVSLTADVSGTLPLANGGTNATTGAGAFANMMGFTTTATAAATTTLTNTSTQYQLFTGATTQTIALPVTTSAFSTGWTFHIVNNSTGTLTVNASSGALVCTIIPNMTAMVTCISTAVTDATAWEFGFTDFGTITGTGAVVLGTGPTITNGVYSGTVGASSPSTGAFTTVTASTSVLSTGAGGIGYATGAGVAVTQLTSRTTTTPTTGAKTTGAVTLFTTTAVVGTYFSFTVPNTGIAVTDTVVLSVRGATNTYVAFVTAITAATSFQVTMASVVGTASDTPIVNFTIIKGVSA